MVRYLLLLAIVVQSANVFGQGLPVKWLQSSDGLKNEYITSTAIDLLGNCYVAGFFDSDSVTFGNVKLKKNTSGHQSYILKVSNDGQVLWGKIIGNPGSVVIQRLTVSSSNSLYAAGYINSGSFTLAGTTISSNDGSEQIFAVKMDLNGTAEWARKLSVSGPVYVSDIGTDNSNNLYVYGTFYAKKPVIGNHLCVNADTSGLTTDMYLLIVSSAGNVSFVNNFGGSQNDNAKRILVDLNGGYVLSGDYSSSTLVVGTTLTNSYSVTENIFVVHFYYDHFLMWSMNVDCEGRQLFSDMAYDSRGGLVVTGMYDEKMEINSNLSLSNSTLGKGSYLLRLNEFGKADWLKSAGLANGWLYPQFIKVDSKNVIYVGGIYNGANLALGSFVLQNASATGSDNGYVAKFSNVGDCVKATPIQAAEGYVLVSSGELNSSGDLYVTGMFYETDLSADNLTVNNSGATGTSDAYITLLNAFTGIEDYTMPESGKLYPVPVVNSLSYQLKDASINNVQITDVTGRFVKEIQIDYPNGVLDVNELPVGWYQLTFFKDGIVVNTLPFVKQDR